MGSFILCLAQPVPGTVFKVNKEDNIGCICNTAGLWKEANLWGPDVAQVGAPRRGEETQGWSWWGCVVVEPNSKMHKGDKFKEICVSQNSWLQVARSVKENLSSYAWPHR